MTAALVDEEPYVPTVAVSPTPAIEAISMVRRGKLRSPGPGPVYVARPRLLEALDHALTTPLTLVVSPAGTGKTTLLAAWAAAAPVPVAWFGVDAADRDASRFWTGLMAALETVVDGCGVGAREAIRQPGGARRAVAQLIDDLESTASGPRVLVVDNVHLADDDPLVAVSLVEFVQSLPPWLHVVVASRHVLGVPLARMRVRGEVTELHFDELRFSTEEALQLLSLLAPDLPAEQARAAAERAAGWAVSLVLERAARAGAVTGAAVSSSTACDDLVHDYVMEEVLGGEERDVVRTLMDVAVVDRVGAGLAETLTGRLDATARLQHAEERGLFIARKGRGGWFELHPAVRAAFVRQLSKSPPRLTQLHRRAARWFADAGAVAAAFGHHTQAGDSREALRLLAANHAHLCDAGDATAVAGMLRQVPPEIATVDVGATLDFTWCHVLVDPPAFVELVGWLTRRLDRRSLRPGERSRINILASIAACMTGDWTRSGALARSSLAQLGENPCRDPLRCFGWTMAARELALAERWDDAGGEVRQMDFSLSADPRRRLELEGVRALGIALAGRPVEVLRLAAGVRRAADVTHRANLLADLSIAEGIAAREVGDRERAVHELQAAASAVTGSFPYHRILATVELAGAAIDDGDLAQAQAQLDRAIALAGPHDGPGHMGCIGRVATRLALARGDIDEARRWAAQVSDGFWSSVGSARVLLAEGRAAAARDALEGARPRCVRHEVVLALVQARAAGCTEEAAKLAGAAIEAASAYGMLQTVASEGDAVVRLVETVAWRVPESWTERLRRASTAAAPRSGQVATVPTSPRDALTGRERDVLRFLPSRLTLREIASELGVSVNTLKFHLKVIYRKLDVASRADAATVARRLAQSG
jgi:LuxR family maltose regulon positive regulatory protein